MDLRERQRPLEDGYRERPDDARISLAARGSEAGEAVSCSVDVGRAVQAAEAHRAATLLEPPPIETSLVANRG